MAGPDGARRHGMSLQAICDSIIFHKRRTGRYPTRIQLVGSEWDLFEKDVLACRYGWLPWQHPQWITVIGVPVFRHTPLDPAHKNRHNRQVADRGEFEPSTPLSA